MNKDNENIGILDNDDRINKCFNQLFYRFIFKLIKVDKGQSPLKQKSLHKLMEPMKISILGARR